MNQAASEPFSIRHAVLPDRDGRWCITVSGGHILALENEDGPVATAEQAWDAQGRLVSPSFVDAHVHLDKALTSERVAPARRGRSLEAAIREVRTVKAGFDVDDVARRATQALRMGLAHGTTWARSHCEADRYVGQRAVAGLRQAERLLGGAVDLQLTAFPQEGWFETAGSLEDGAGAFVAEAAASKAVNAVGGNVNAALWPSDPCRQVDETFALALQHDLDVDYHLDNWDGTQAFNLPDVARKTIEAGWQGRVAVAHIASLPHVPDAQAHDAIALVREAGIHVCVLPTRMRLTRVRELMDAGVNVACGTDNLRDPFVRYGDADPLKAMLLLAQLTDQLSDERLRAVWPTFTTAAARMLRLPRYGLEPGDVASLVVFDATSVPQAVLHQAARLAVLHRGRQVAGPVAVTAAGAAHVP